MKTIFISGASSGFGKLTVPLLLEKGHTVIAGMRGGNARLEALFPEELRQFRGRLSAVDLHLEKSSEFVSIVQQVPKLDVLINNAGYGLLGVLEDQTEEQIRYQMEINFIGTALLTRAFLPALRQARGRILNVSSLAGRAGFPFYGLYCASKFALEGLSECLYYDLKPFEVQVGLIEPGGFRTQFATARQFGEEKAGSPYRERTEAFTKAFEMTQSRLDDPMKVARLIADLCDKPRICLRNPIGKDAKAILIFRRILPRGIYHFLVDFIFGMALKKAR